VKQCRETESGELTVKVTFLLAVAGFMSAAIAGAQSTTLRFDLSGGRFAL